MARPSARKSILASIDCRRGHWYILGLPAIVPTIKRRTEANPVLNGIN